MKKKICCFLTMMLLLAVPVSAHPPITVYVDGQVLSFDQPPVIIDDRTLVPMRVIFQALGSEISWNDATNTITSTRGSDTVILRIGEKELYKNGQPVYTMPVPACIVNERALVPLRAVSEAFGAEVGWDPVGYVVDIKSPVQGGSDVSLQKGGYQRTVTATDGTVVLNVKIDCLKSSGAMADTIETAVSEKAFQMGEGFAREYGEKAKAAYEKAKKAGTSFTPYYLLGSFELTREDSSYVSYFGTTTRFYGDKQEQRKGHSYTFSAKSGKELALGDIITDSQEELESFWSASFGALIDAKPASFYNDATKKLSTAMNQVDFYLTKNGVAFYIQPETIAPSETGIVSFTVEYPL